MEVSVAASEPRGANLVLTTGPSSLPWGSGASDTMEPMEMRNMKTHLTQKEDLENGF